MSFNRERTCYIQPGKYSLIAILMIILLINPDHKNHWWCTSIAEDQWSTPQTGGFPTFPHFPLWRFGMLPGVPPRLTRLPVVHPSATEPGHWQPRPGWWPTGAASNHRWREESMDKIYLYHIFTELMLYGRTNDSSEWLIQVTIW